jgi:hypothetical protein
VMWSAQASMGNGACARQDGRRRSSPESRHDVGVAEVGLSGGGTLVVVGGRWRVLLLDKRERGVRRTQQFGEITLNGDLLKNGAAMALRPNFNERWGLGYQGSAKCGREKLQREVGC